MQLAGRNLADLRKSSPKKSFTLNTSIRLAEQTMDAIEAMHGSGLLHRDIKPANFAIGYAEREAKNIYLLDFGLVRQYKMRDGTLRAPRHKTGFRGTVSFIKFSRTISMKHGFGLIGTPKYASINCHKNLDLGRHDDLWSWLYMVFEFVKGELPWQKEPDKDKVFQIKDKAKDKLLEGMEAEFTQFYDTLTPLTYYDEPPYHTYRSRLFQIMQRKEIKSNDPFDWEPGGAYFKEAKGVDEQPYKKQIQSRQKVVKEKDKDAEDSNAVPKQ